MTLFDSCKYVFDISNYPWHIHTSISALQARKIVAHIDMPYAANQSDLLHEYCKLEVCRKTATANRRIFRAHVGKLLRATYGETMSYLDDRHSNCRARKSKAIKKNPVLKTYSERIIHQLANPIEIEVLLAGQVLLRRMKYQILSTFCRWVIQLQTPNDLRRSKTLRS